jgi:hypothetical protein
MTTMTQSASILGPPKSRTGLIWCSLIVIYGGCVLANMFISLKTVGDQLGATADASAIARLQISTLCAALIAPLRDGAKICAWALLTGWVATILGERRWWSGIFWVTVAAGVLSDLAATIAGASAAFLGHSFFLLHSSAATATGGSGQGVQMFFAEVTSPSALVWWGCIFWGLWRSLKWNRFHASLVSVAMLLVNVAWSTYLDITVMRA